MLINVLTVHYCITDVNFDDYDKSDDPQDYKFVRWLTKEKVKIILCYCLMKRLHPSSSFNLQITL